MEAFASINDIKIYQAEDYFINRFRNFSRLFAKTNATYSALVASPKFIFEMLVFISIAFSSIAWFWLLAQSWLWFLKFVVEVSSAALPPRVFVVPIFEYVQVILSYGFVSALTELM